MIGGINEKKTHSWKGKHVEDIYPPPIRRCAHDLYVCGSTHEGDIGAQEGKQAKISEFKDASLSFELKRGRRKQPKWGGGNVSE
jgi:hypothetical protein